MDPPVRNAFIIDKALPEIPQMESLCSNLRYHNLLKAFEKSISRDEFIAQCPADSDSQQLRHYPWIQQGEIHTQEIISVEMFSNLLVDYRFEVFLEDSKDANGVIFTRILTNRQYRRHLPYAWEAYLLQTGFKQFSHDLR